MARVFIVFGKWYTYNIYNFIYLLMLQLYSLYYIYIGATFYLLNFTKNFLYEFILT